MVEKKGEDCSKKILSIILLLIILVSILSTWTILSIIEGPKKDDAIYYEYGNIKEPPQGAAIGLTILPSEKEKGENK